MGCWKRLFYMFSRGVVKYLSWLRSDMQNRKTHILFSSFAAFANQRLLLVWKQYSNELVLIRVQKDTATIATFPPPISVPYGMGKKYMKYKQGWRSNHSRRTDETGNVRNRMVVRMNCREVACISAAYCISVTTEGCWVSASWVVTEASALNCADRNPKGFSWGYCYVKERFCIGYQYWKTARGGQQLMVKWMREN